MKPSPEMKPTQIELRQREDSYLKQATLKPLPTRKATPVAATPVCDDIRDHKLPVVKAGQGRADEDMSADALVIGVCLAICGLVCLLMVLAK
jgi:hypothetical protein